MRYRKSTNRLVLETARASAKALEYFFKAEMLKKEIEAVKLAQQITNEKPQKDSKEE